MALIFLLGPRASTDVDVGENDLPAISGLSLYLEKSELQFSQLIPETRKRIAWAGDQNVVTPISFVYLHGFSDSNRVQGDSIDRIAAKFGANVFYTRYAGHGYEDEADVEALGNATFQQWADDTIEALRIGRLIGRKVVVIGFSTGAPLGTWAATQEEAPDALIMVSPNFGLKDWTSEFAPGPWGKLIVRASVGEFNKYDAPGTVSKNHERYATSEYNSKAIVTMMSAVKLGRESDLSKITSPVLAVYSEEDKIIATPEFHKVMAKIGSSVSEKVAIRSSTGHPGKENHILCGTRSEQQGSNAGS